jgi:ABC-type nitrate/sulfonate/bicarbonate transport system ATPase subunit
VSEKKVNLVRIAKKFPKGHSFTQVFEELDFSCRENEFVSLLGPSGCGKTTLINLIAGFLRPDSGRILVDGQPVNGPHHKRSVIFQDDAVFPWLTVRQNLAYGPKSRGLNHETIMQKVNRFLEVFELQEHENSYSKTLSSGERKRVDLARALMNDPDLLLMDEPFGSLDSLTKERLQAFVLDFFQHNKITIIFITHDIEEAIVMSDTIFMLSKKPSHIVKVYDVPFERPREISVKYTIAFQDFRRTIFNEFKTITKDHSPQG